MLRVSMSGSSRAIRPKRYRGIDSIGMLFLIDLESEKKSKELSSDISSLALTLL